MAWEDQPVTVRRGELQANARVRDGLRHDVRLCLRRLSKIAKLADRSANDPESDRVAVLFKIARMAREMQDL